MDKLPLQDNNFPSSAAPSRLAIEKTSNAWRQSMPQQSYNYTLIDPPFGPGGTGNRFVSIGQVNDLGQVLGTVSRQATGSNIVTGS
jgi:hypothetical protein